MEAESIDMRYSWCGDTVAREGFLQMSWAGVVMRVAAFQVNAVVTGFMALSFALCPGHDTASFDSPIPRPVIARLPVRHALAVNCHGIQQTA